MRRLKQRDCPLPAGQDWSARHQLTVDDSGCGAWQLLGFFELLDHGLEFNSPAVECAATYIGQRVVVGWPVRGSLLMRPCSVRCPSAS